MHKYRLPNSGVRKALPLAAFVIVMESIFFGGAKVFNSIGFLLQPLPWVEQHCIRINHRQLPEKM